MNARRTKRRNTVKRFRAASSPTLNRDEFRREDSRFAESSNASVLQKVDRKHDLWKKRKKKN
jgi:hypothetical protein